VVRSSSAQIRLQLAMALKTDIGHIMGKTPDDGHCKIAKTKIICTLGPKSREVPVLEKLLHAGMNVARFNFSHGSHEYQQYTLDNLRQAMVNTKIMCAVLLDTKVQGYCSNMIVLRFV
jgi:pyruvate kinase